MADVNIHIPRQVGLAVRKRRVSLGMTQAQLADAAGISLRLVSKLELGDADGMGIGNLINVLEALEMTISLSWPDAFAFSEESPKDDNVQNNAQNSKNAQDDAPVSSKSVAVKPRFDYAVAYANIVETAKANAAPQTDYAVVSIDDISGINDAGGDKNEAV